MKKIFLIFISIFICSNINAQNNLYILGFKDSTQRSVSFNFKLINNLIIIPLSVNNSDSLFFILDSGINPTILTSNNYSLVFKTGRTSSIAGLGQDKDLSVLQTYGNTITIAQDALLTLQNIFIIDDHKFELSQKMGTRIDGIIGGVIFNNFVVKINYDRKKITLINPKKFKQKRYRRWLKIPIEIHNKKPYINLKIALNKDTLLNLKLLFDLGASDAIWLMQNTNDSIKFSHFHKRYYLGQGLNGDIFGTYDRIYRIYFNKKIYFKNVLVSLPDTASIHLPKDYNTLHKNGTLGSEIIKRFNVVVDYQDKQIFLKKNYFYHSKFKTDLSGLDIDAPYVNIPIYEVYNVQKNSPADIAGLKEGDVILKINNVHAFEYSLNDINLLFRARVGKKIRIEYQRGTKKFKTKLILRDYKFDSQTGLKN